jgi:Ni/Co efflux regulator RcnB
MKNLRKIILSAMVAGVLVVPAVSANADTKDGKAYSHSRKNDQHGSWKSDQGRRDGYYGRGRDQHGRYDRHSYRRDVRHDNRGHHNKPEIRQDFKDVRNARNEVKEGRKELRGDYQELRKDRAELRRDIRNGASKQEIFKDRQEIRDDFKEIHKDRADLRQDQARLDATRRELKSDLRKR